MSDDFNKIKISVIIPVYNAEKYLDRAVISALDQPETGEVVLVEDASPDNALERCHKLEKEYEKVKLFRHPDGKNHGAGASRNLGIKKARFDYIAFLDADDYYLPNRFKKTAEVFSEHNDADGVYECVGMNFQNKEREKYWLTEIRPTLNTTLSGKVSPENLLEAVLKLGMGWIHLDGLVVKKEVFSKTQLFDENLILSQDAELTIRLIAKFRLYPGEIRTPVASRFWHQENRMGKMDTAERHYKMLCAKTVLMWSENEHLDAGKKKNIYDWAKNIFLLNLKDDNLSQKTPKRYLELKVIMKMIMMKRFFWSSFFNKEVLGIISKKARKFVEKNYK